jgi:hypothetical protein
MGHPSPSSKKAIFLPRISSAFLGNGPSVGSAVRARNDDRRHLLDGLDGEVKRLGRRRRVLQPMEFAAGDDTGFDGHEPLPPFETAVCVDCVSQKLVHRFPRFVRSSVMGMATIRKDPRNRAINAQAASVQARLLEGFGLGQLADPQKVPAAA